MKIFRQPRIEARKPGGVSPIFLGVSRYIAADILSGGNATPLERILFVADPFIVTYAAQLGAAAGAQEPSNSDPESIS